MLRVSCVHLILLVVPSFILHRLVFSFILWNKAFLKKLHRGLSITLYFEICGISVQTQKFENTLYLNTYSYLSIISIFGTVGILLLNS